jgi:hypothetical protein
LNRFLYIPVIITALLTGPAPARAAEAPPAAGGAASDSIFSMEAAPAKIACARVAARAFGEDICLTDLVSRDKDQQEAIRKAYEEQGMDADSAQHIEAMRELETKIWDKGFERKYGADKAKPTDAEIDTYLTALRAQVAQRQKDGRELSILVKKLLDENRYSPEDEQSLAEILAANDRSVKFYEEREKQNKEMPPEFQEMSDKAERSIAEAVVKDWKHNKLLFETYGGRLAMHNGRVMPLDAQQKFLEWIRAAGKPEVLDPEFRGMFSELRLYLKKPQGIIPKGKEDIYKNYYSSPDWILKLSGQQSELAQNMKTLLAVPTLGKKPKQAVKQP